MHIGTNRDAGTPLPYILRRGIIRIPNFPTPMILLLIPLLLHRPEVFPEENLLGEFQMMSHGINTASPDQTAHFDFPSVTALLLPLAFHI